MITNEGPIYKRLFNEIKHQIEVGDYKKGDLLPSENELCKLYNTTRPTVRQALSSLSRSGYIKRQQGKGSIVTDPKQAVGILSLKGRTSVVRQNSSQVKIISGPTLYEWPNPFEFHLTDREISGGCITISRIRYMEEEPIVLEEIYLSNTIIPQFISSYSAGQSINKFLRQQYEIETTGGEQRIWALEATKLLAQQLNMKVKEPLLLIKRKIETNHPSFHVFVFMYCKTDSYCVSDHF